MIKIKQKITRPKGMGAHYSADMKYLGTIHKEILSLLSEYGPRTKSEITKLLNEKAKIENRPIVGGFTVSGRLSELCGLGLVWMRYEKTQFFDHRTNEYLIKTKPVWHLKSTKNSL